MAQYVANYDEKFVKSFVLEADEGAVEKVPGYDSAIDLVKAGPVWIESEGTLTLVTAAEADSLTAGETEYSYEATVL